MSSHDHSVPPYDSLDDLFVQLRNAQSHTEAEHVAEAIWKKWFQHQDAQVDMLMKSGADALEREELEKALDIFTDVVERDPEFAEGWNKRATVRYVMGDYGGAVRDLKRTLELEPRHFGALSGLGAVYLIVMAREQALQVFERLLEIYPLAPQVRKQVRALRDTLGDNG